MSMCAVVSVLISESAEAAPVLGWCADVCVAAGAVAAVLVSVAGTKLPVLMSESAESAPVPGCAGGESCGVVVAALALALPASRVLCVWVVCESVWVGGSSSAKARRISLSPSRYAAAAL